MSTIEQPSCSSSRTTLPQRLARLHVEADRGLVEEQQLRTSADRHARTAPGASGRPTDPAVSAIRQAFERQPANHRIDVVRARVVARHLLDELARPHRRASSATSCIMMPMRRRASISCGDRGRRAPRVPASAILQPEQQRDRGGFAGAIRPEHREQLAAPAPSRSSPSSARILPKCLRTPLRLARGGRATCLPPCGGSCFAGARV